MRCTRAVDSFQIKLRLPGARSVEIQIICFPLVSFKDKFRRISSNVIYCSNACVASQKWRFGWGNYYPPTAGSVTLHQGDFVESVEVSEWIRKADVVLVNSYIFSSDWRHSIQHPDLHNTLQKNLE